MGVKVLFVDDDEEILASYRRVFIGRFEVATALSGREAMAVAEAQGPFAAVVADYLMPGMDGLTLLGRIKEISPETVRVLLTGHTEAESAARAEHDGLVDVFLDKPCLPHLLAEVLEGAVGGLGGRLG